MLAPIGLFYESEKRPWSLACVESFTAASALQLGEAGPGIGLALLFPVQDLVSLLVVFSFVFSAYQLGMLGLAYWGRWQLRRSGEVQVLRAAGIRRVALVSLAAFFVLLLIVRWPVCALISLVSGPALLLFWSKVRLHQRQSAWEDSALVYFHALQGLIRSGLGFSTALFRLAEVQKTPFAQAMARSLEAFESGKPLGDCLQRFGQRFPSPVLVACLRSLQTAYQQGLSTAPLLDQVLRILESQRERQRRSRVLRKSALAQAAVAFVLPWLLLAVFLAFQPHMGGRWSESPAHALLGLTVLVWEMGGLWWIHRVTRFY